MITLFLVWILRNTGTYIPDRMFAILYTLEWCIYAGIFIGLLVTKS